MFEFPRGDGMFNAYSGRHGINLVTDISLQFKLVEREMRFGQIDQKTQAFTALEYDTFVYPESDDEDLYTTWKCKDKYGLHTLPCELCIMKFLGCGETRTMPKSVSSGDYLRLSDDLCEAQER